MPGFEDEDDDEDEYEEPHEWRRGQAQDIAQREAPDNTQSGAAFRARFFKTPHPGLKPWAILYSRFAAKPLFDLCDLCDLLFKDLAANP